MYYFDHLYVSQGEITPTLVPITTMKTNGWAWVIQHTIQKVPLWDFMDGMKLSHMSQSNAASLKATTMRSSTRSCCVFFLVKVLEVPRPQWRRDPCHRAFFCVQVPEVPKAMTTKNLAPHCHSFLFQWCKSFKRTTTRSLAPHHHVFFYYGVACPKDMVMRSPIPCHRAFLLQYCKSFKHITMASSPPHHHVFFVPTFQVPRATTTRNSVPCHHSFVPML